MASALEHVYDVVQLQQTLTTQLRSPLLARVVTELTDLLDGVNQWSSALNQEAAK